MINALLPEFAGRGSKRLSADHTFVTARHVGQGTGLIGGALDGLMLEAPIKDRCSPNTNCNTAYLETYKGMTS